MHVYRTAYPAQGGQRVQSESSLAPDRNAYMSDRLRLNTTTEKFRPTV